MPSPSLLTTGRTRLYQVPQLVSLTHQMKLASIPVTEEGKEEVQGEEPTPRAVVTFIPSTAAVR